MRPTYRRTVATRRQRLARGPRLGQIAGMVDRRAGRLEFRDRRWLSRTTAALFAGGATALPLCSAEPSQVLVVTGTITLAWCAWLVGRVGFGPRPLRLRVDPAGVCIRIASPDDIRRSAVSPEYTIPILMLRGVAARDAVVQGDPQTETRSIANRDVILYVAAPTARRFAEAIAERAREAERPRPRWYGSVTVRRRATVRVESTDRIIVDWSAIAPRPRRAGPRIAAAVGRPWLGLENDDALDFEGQILALASSGRRLAAIERARVLSGDDLEVASAFVDELEHQNGHSPSA